MVDLLVARRPWWPTLPAVDGRWEAWATIYQGAAADREAAAELREALRGRRAVLDRIVEGMEAALHPGLDPVRAAAILRALC